MVFTSVTAQEAATQGYVVPARPAAPSPDLKVVCVYLLVTLDGDGGDDDDGGSGGRADAEAAESRQLKAFTDRVERILRHSGLSL